MIPIKIVCYEELIAEFQQERILSLPRRGDTIQLLMNKQHEVYVGYTAWKVDDVRFFMDVDFGKVDHIHLYVSPSSNVNPKVDSEIEPRKK